MDICLEAKPPLFQVGEMQVASCYLYDNKGTMDNPDIGAMFTKVETAAVA
jgi:hypothetical protein